MRNKHLEKSENSIFLPILLKFESFINKLNSVNI